MHNNIFGYWKVKLFNSPSKSNSVCAVVDFIFDLNDAKRSNVDLGNMQVGIIWCSDNSRESRQKTVHMYHTVCMSLEVTPFMTLYNFKLTNLIIPELKKIRNE